ncbi:MAG: cadherin repeat domain-containing protein, partial [Desulfobulbaceae bacterium]|nr:cadherin repeat domain-containing protein [Desulfobulbaceae bacterium]
MANETDGEKENAVTEGLGQEQQIERASVAPDGTITIPQCEAKLESVDVADVDLLLSFSDGTFVIIPNGALDAISDSLNPVVFIDNNDSAFDSAHFSYDHKSSLGDLFKMVGSTSFAKAGSLRAVSEHVDAPKTLEDEATEAQTEALVTSAEVTLPDTFTQPEQVPGGKGPGDGATPSSESVLEAPELDPVAAPEPDVRPVVKSGQKTETITDETPPEVNVGQTFSYAENQDIGDVVAIVAATDDVEVTGYQIVSGNTDGYFAIEANGQITLTQTGVLAEIPNDFENGANSFTLGIQAGDAADNWSAAENITLNVTNQDETDPEVTPDQTFSYVEGKLAGELVATVAASDDVGVSGYQFSATGTETSANGYFTITSDGQIRITTDGTASNRNIYDTTNIFNYGIQAIDTADNLSAAVDVTLKVTPISVSADTTDPVITSNQIFSYAENQTSLSSVIGAVVAYDAVGVTSYQIVSGNIDGYFAINNSGHITLTDIATDIESNDFETVPNTFTLGIQAQDAAGNFDVKDVTLNVTDSNDPATISGTSTGAITETDAIQSTGGTLTVSDIDTGENVFNPQTGVAGSNGYGTFSI